MGGERRLSNSLPGEDLSHLDAYVAISSENPEFPQGWAIVTQCKKPVQLEVNHFRQMLTEGLGQQS